MRAIYNIFLVNQIRYIYIYYFIYKYYKIYNYYIRNMEFL